MAKQQPKTTPWNKIKAEYLAGATPKSLSIKYEITAKSISSKANQEKWTSEKRIITEKITETVINKTILSADEVLEAISTIAQDKEQRTNDRLKALELLGKRHKLFTDKIEQNTTLQPLTPEQRKQISKDFGFE